ncbi:hypothetical protein Ppb6_01175 [Photorhabdus australis subsp. thailandensis]|uniref:Uncharacterized protein n=1 Tax=Photorhabdus australis subsp. thailandensis TaxID=2805096 RepID=A0A1C0U6J8_9GAMM|nr:hypothetical protein [Photorhabdus australis]OCQ53549.1 hypothetical protein Ppb6_01175 [Photorhabdus australis subsp. thailandensis]
MLVKKYYPFGFTMDESIPKPIALELVAIKQVLMTILARMEPEKRQGIVEDLSNVDSPIMNDIVKNLKLIDQD